MAQLKFSSPTHTLLASKLAKTPNAKLTLVDYGCGEGEILSYLPLKSIYSYHGYEVNAACIPVAKKKWSHLRKVVFTVIDRSHLPSLGKKNEVDALFLIGVIQYLPQSDLKHVLKQARKVLKPGGQLLISCTTDHKLYSWVNIYRYFLPHFVVRRDQLIKEIESQGLKIDEQFERGIFFTPFFSNVLVFFFDVADKLLFRTKGELGPIGRWIRKACSPIIKKEFQLKLDYGYTLFIVASK